MSNEYTPTLEEIREVWGDRSVSREGRSTSQWRELSVLALAEFDRAIAKIKAEAKVEALREASNDWWLEADPGKKFDTWQWLKARADNLEES